MNSEQQGIPASDLTVTDVAQRLRLFIRFESQFCDLFLDGHLDNPELCTLWSVVDVGPYQMSSVIRGRLVSRVWRQLYNRFGLFETQLWTFEGDLDD